MAHSWLGDVFIVLEFQWKGLGRWLMECVVSHPILQQTSCDPGPRDAHEHYEKFAFGLTQWMIRPKNGVDQGLGDRAFRWMGVSF